MRWRLGAGKRPTLGVTLLRPEVLGNPVSRQRPGATMPV